MGIGRKTMLGSAAVGALIAGATFMGSPRSPVISSATAMSAVNHAVHLYGYVCTEDGQSHTIDTSGQSAMMFYTVAATFNNAGSTLKLGIASVDTAATVTPRAVNSSGVATLDVSKTITGGTAITTGGQWYVPDAGSKTIANGDFVCLVAQLTARGGSDSITIGANGNGSSPAYSTPGVSYYNASTYTKLALTGSVLIRFSDGAYGWFEGAAFNSSANVSTLYQNSSNPDEYGNLFRLHAPVRVSGIAAQLTFASVNATADVCIYEQPLTGSPVLVQSYTLDPKKGTGTSQGQYWIPFPAPFVLKANTEYVLSLRATGAANVTLDGYDIVDAGARHLASGVADGYGVSRNNGSGAFASVQSQRRRYSLNLIVDAFHDGVNSTFGKGF